MKAVDADRNTITLTVNRKNPEDREFKTTKDTRVVTEINGVPLRLADLRADREVLLRLSLDQKVDVRITVRGE